ncbi:Zinc-finger homeodomain protein 11 [Sesamum angolense]|uniref:Zinc-finger homeodomain protein 11 n=1 Tax=Sesamum angolense TaxID=2727404 RepID=A0AAE2BS54_9LAMI|nr:Zinc-finger homeodomain protein 11 [Sesamum angolense]
MEGDSSNDIYRECLRNHAASLGSYATDGCGEFTLDDTVPGGGLNCAACGCHRNFHRKVIRSQAHEAAADIIIEYASGGSGRQQVTGMAYSPESSERGSKKRFRTKFTAEQKEKMLGFAEKLGWKLQRKDEEDEIERFCRGVGISRKVFKVWMHNHKNSPPHSTGNASSLTDQ